MRRDDVVGIDPANFVHAIECRLASFVHKPRCRLVIHAWPKRKGPQARQNLDDLACVFPDGE
jgi:hypothetical protein